MNASAMSSHKLGIFIYTLPSFHCKQGQLGHEVTRVKYLFICVKENRNVKELVQYMGLRKWGMERWMKGLRNGLLLIDGVIDQKRLIQHYRQIKLKDWDIGQPAVCLERNYRTG